jgi:hypothetical protein
MFNNPKNLSSACARLQIRPKCKPPGIKCQTLLVRDGAHLLPRPGRLNLTDVCLRLEFYPRLETGENLTIIIYNGAFVLEGRTRTTLTLSQGRLFVSGDESVPFLFSTRLPQHCTALVCLSPFIFCLSPLAFCLLPLPSRSCFLPLADCFLPLTEIRAFKCPAPWSLSAK